MVEFERPTFAMREKPYRSPYLEWLPDRLLRSPVVAVCTEGQPYG